MHPIAWEIARDLKGERLDCFVPALGNGVSAIGIGEALQGNLRDGTGPYPKISIIGFEAFEAPVVYRMKYGDAKFLEKYGVEPDFHPHKSPGVSAYGIDFRFLRKNLKMIDDIILVKGNVWPPAQARLRDLETLCVGPTTAMGLAAAEHLARKTEGNNYVIIGYDRWENY